MNRPTLVTELEIRDLERRRDGLDLLVRLEAETVALRAAKRSG